MFQPPTIDAAKREWHASAADRRAALLAPVTQQQIAACDDNAVTEVLRIAQRGEMTPEQATRFGIDLDDHRACVLAHGVGATPSFASLPAAAACDLIRKGKFSAALDAFAPRGELYWLGTEPITTALKWMRVWANYTRETLEAQA